MKSQHVGVRDAGVTVLAAAALLLWDVSGADRVVTGWFGGPQGFALREHFWTSTVGHSGGRLLAWALLLALVVQALRKPAQTTTGVRAQPSRAERGYWLGATLLCLLVVPTIKRFSSTSCPWDTAPFGGTAQALSHWAWGVADGGPGHCFPSGHAVGAFAFFSLYFLWRPHRAARARGWLAGVLVMGCLFGLAQLARGAHHASHAAWSAWVCWTLCVLAAAFWRYRNKQQRLPGRQ